MANEFACGNKRWNAAERVMANELALWDKHRIATERATGVADNRRNEHNIRGPYQTILAIWAA